jgi:hypothetical protein
LIARDDDFASRPTGHARSRERIEDEEDRRRTIIHNQSIFGARRRAQERRHACVTRTTRSRCEIEFEVGVATRNAVHRGERLGRQRRATEIGMQQNTRAVEHVDEAIVFFARESCANAREHHVVSGDRNGLADRTRTHFA